MNFIIFNHDGSIKNVNFAEIIVQGNNLVDEIFVAVEGRSTDSYLATAYFDLPNGDSNFLTATPASQSIDQSAYNGYKFLLTGAQTAFYGRVRMSLKLEGMQGETLWTYEQVLTINKSGYNPDFTMISMSQYAALVQAMGSLQEKFVVNNARFYSSLENAQADLDNLAFNQCVIIADVTATDPIPEIYFKNAESQLELLAGIGEYTFQAGTTTTQTLAPGSDATVSVSFVASGKTITMNFTFGIPRGDTGATGNGISSVAKISTDGIVDTYRISFTNGSHFDYTVTNGTLAGKLAVATFVYDSSSAVNFTQQLAKFIIDLVGDDLDKVKSITRLYTVPSAYTEYRGETVLFDIFRYLDHNSKFYLPDGTQITTSTDAYQFSILYEVDGITVADIGYFELSSSDTSGDLDDDQAQEARKTVCLIKRGNDIFHFDQEYEGGTKYFKTIPAMRVTGYKQGSIEINGLDSNSPTWEYESEDYDMDSAPTQNSTNLVTSGGVHSAITTLDSKISKNAEDIATLTEALIKKDLYETQEATFQGMVAVPAGAMVKAYLDGFKGNSAVVNQLIPTASRNVNFTAGSNTSISLVSGLSIPRGHTILLLWKQNATLTSNLTNTPFVRMVGTGGGDIRLSDAANYNLAKGSYYWLLTNTATLTGVFYWAREPDVDYGIEDVMLIDLTQAGLTSAEMASYAAAKAALKPKGMDVDSYIPYNAGTLTDSKPTKLISRGYNLFDGELERGRWKSDGSSQPYDPSSYRSVNYIKVDPSFQYTIDISEQAENATLEGIFVMEYKQQGTGVGSATRISQLGTNKVWTFTLSSGTKYIKFYVDYDTNLPVPSNPRISLSMTSASLGYKPYVPPIEYDLTMPTLKSAGSVHDESKSGGSKVGSKDLSTVSWAYTSEGGYFYTDGNVSYIKKSASASVAFNGLVTRKYKIAPQDDQSNLTLIEQYSNATARLVIRNSDYTDPTTFKTSLSGNILNYEKAQYSDFSDPISYPEIIDVYAGGSIEVVGDGCDATAKVYFYVEA